jgi:hypothetical protein
MVDLHQKADDPPKVFDLSGGQPDLTPEWIPWMMRQLRARGLEKSLYLWSDDNLSNDYFWRFLEGRDIDLIRGYCNYGKACCFKGFNSGSFAFNTGAAPELFERQFELCGRHVGVGLDLYAYATFTTPIKDGIGHEMKVFVDRLQRVHPNLPLRTVPLQIRRFSPTKDRMKPLHEDAIRNQEEAIKFWNQEIQTRFSPAERQLSISEVPLPRI